MPGDLVEIIDAVYKKAKKLNPELTESVFLQRVFEEWLEPYRREIEHTAFSKKTVVLRNNLKQIFEICSKSQTEVAGKMGVNRAYLGQVVNGKYDPSVLFVLLMVAALEYPPEKMKDLFYLESVAQE